MNLQQLSRHLRLNEELEKDREMLENIKAKAYSVSSPALSGMPHGGGVTQKTEAFAVEITDLETRIAFLKTEISLERKAVSDYCDTIDKMQTRNVFRFRFLHCMTWAEVADMVGPYCSESAVKTLCYNYIDEHKQREA